MHGDRSPRADVRGPNTLLGRRLLPSERPSWSAVPIEHLSLSLRARRVIRGLGIRTLTELAETDRLRLRAAPECGRRTLAELAAVVALGRPRLTEAERVLACWRAGIDVDRTWSRTIVGRSLAPAEVLRAARTLVPLDSMSERAVRVLARLGVLTVLDLAALPELGAIMTKECGRQTRDELRRVVVQALSRSRGASPGSLNVKVSHDRDD